MPGNPFQQLQNLYKKPELIPAEVSQVKHLTTEDKRLIKRIGLTFGMVRRDLLKDIQVQYDRMSLYHQIERALEHWLVGAAAELYASYCTVFSSLHNATVWITSESSTYHRELTKLLDRIGIEEKIFDWAYSTGTYGDLFVQVNGIPGKGIVSINDSGHPLNMSRVDHEGILIGYYKTPLGQIADRQRLLAPWEYVHFRLLGGKKKRPRFGDPMYAEFRTMHLLVGMDIKQVTTRYGTSLLLNALPSYRRLRLAEDSLLLARLSRGIIRYIWKLKVDSTNMESVGELVDQYSSVLREARAWNTSSSEPNFESKENPMAVIEDLFLPVWDNVGDLTFDKIGGEADIRWIRDIEDLRNQLAASLRVPVPLLGAYLKEATGALGSQAIEKLDINFARVGRKLQRAVRNGIKRICQIHLAYMNMDPDPNLFDVQMPEMSTAEEESLKESLKDGMDVVDQVMTTIEKLEEEGNTKYDKAEIFNYLNEKILKLEDFDLNNFRISTEAIPECRRRSERREEEEKIRAIIEKAIKKDNGQLSKRLPLFDTDLVSYVPTHTHNVDGLLEKQVVKRLTRGGNWLGVERSSEAWKNRFANAVVAEDLDMDVERRGQLVLPFGGK